MCITTKLVSGQRLVTASYGGDGNYAPSSTSASITLYVSNVPTSITVTPATNSVNIDQPLLVTATLSGFGSLPLPTGTLYFSAVQPNFDTVGQVSPVQITNGSASFTFPANSLIIGPLNLYAYYTGDSYYGSILATAPIQVHSSGTVSPTVNLILPSTPVGSALPVTVNVSGPSGDPLPTGSLTLLGSRLSWPLVDGSASFTVSIPMQPGSNTITVTYSGDSTYATTSASGSVTRMGNASISFSPFNPTIVSNNALKVDVTVTGVTNLPAPSGTVTLSSGIYSSSAIALAGGLANFTIPADTFPVGTDSVTAAYSGDTYYAPDAASEFVLVTAVPVGINLTASSVAIAAGATTNNWSTITVTPQGEFIGSVALTAAITSVPAGAQYMPTLSFGSTSPVSITGSSATTATLTITTTAATSAALSHPKVSTDRWYIAGGFSLACILLFGIPARRRAWRNMLAALVLFLALVAGVNACGGGGGGGGGTGGGSGKSGTTPGNYTITVTGTSGSIIGSSTVSLVVQ